MHAESFKQETDAKPAVSYQNFNFSIIIYTDTPVLSCFCECNVLFLLKYFKLIFSCKTYFFQFNKPA